MNPAANESIVNFLNYFHKSKDCGLLIVSHREQVASVLGQLKSRGMALAQSWRGVLYHLALDTPVVFYMNHTMLPEEFDLIRQYQNQNGMIQLLDTKDKDLLTVHCNTRNARLLLLAADEDIRLIEKQFEFISSVGIIEYV